MKTRRPYGMKTNSYAQEFDCSDCGRHIVVLCGPPTERCAACQVMPGWFHDPELAHRIDPDFHPKSVQ